MDRLVAYLATLLLGPALCRSALHTFVPCSEVSEDLRLPCVCALGPPEAALDGSPAIALNCDRAVFAGEYPTLPFGAPIVEFSQRWAGHQALPAQVFASAGLPLRAVDLSGNALRRLGDGHALRPLRNTLRALRLADNHLGDALNPVFATGELRGLTGLKLLDLSGNGIKAVEEGILEGCDGLQELYLDRNSFRSIPSSSLNGPKLLRKLTLRDNRIDKITTNSFQSQQGLEYIDLSNNLISLIEGGSLVDLKNLKTLRLSHNRLSRFNSDVFQGADNLLNIDLSENFIVEFPTVALKAFTSLRNLNLSSNMIQNVDNNNLIYLGNLHEFDLSRNNLANIMPGTFLGLKQLRRLDISVNSLRTIEDDAFEGLDNLEYLNIKDNNILLLPASAVGRLPHLSFLQLNYNRIAALSGDILRSISDKVTKLDLSKNVVRELPAGSFENFQNLQYLDLTRNLITTLNSDALSGLENTLKELHLSQNRIANLAGNPISLLKLEVLDLNENHIEEFTKNTFSDLPLLKHLNISRNTHLSNIPVSLLHKLPNLEIFDLSRSNVKMLVAEFFSKSTSLKEIYLSHNSIVDIPDKAFSNMPNMTVIDLSFNKITNIKQGAFVHIMNIRKLNLKGNELTSFKGEFFDTGTSLEILDISENQLSYLFPSSFRIHPRLKEIYASSNKFNFFPAELIANLQFLEYIDLSYNQLKTVEELDFAKLPRLRCLNLGHNELENFSEMVFHNSTQVQRLDLSYNKLDRLGDRTFEGLVRLESLNLEGNQLVDLPDMIFDRVRLQMLENIQLAKNKFEIAPLKALQKQYFFLDSVDLSRNNLKEIPADDSIMVNIKKLDVSFNPLSKTAIKNILGEPKTVRTLNLAGTGIEGMVNLETPFLRNLNVSNNNITGFTEKTFERTTLLESLDLSYNQIRDISGYSNIWKLLHNLQVLNISGNPIVSISQDDFVGLENLRYLSLHSLLDCIRVEKNAFSSITNIAGLQLHTLPRLGYLDIAGVLKYMPLLERVYLETKDASIGSEQLQSVLHPRLKELGITGSRLKTISSGTLSGLKGPRITLLLTNTSVSILPPALLFPVPRSSLLTIDVSGGALSALSPPLLAALEDRRGDAHLHGLDSNPIRCDCAARALRRWLPTHAEGNVRCASPERLAGKLLIEVGDTELSCDQSGSSSTASASSATSTKGTRPTSRATEPDIIWSIAPTEQSPRAKQKTVTQGTGGAVNNDDTVIIGIVGGVVSFIAILVIGICIVRLRAGRSSSPTGVVVGPPGSSCACSVKGAPASTAAPIYAIPPGYSATLPHKMAAGQAIRPSNYSTMGRMPYYQGQVQPYFIAAYPSDEKIYR